MNTQYAGFWIRFVAVIIDGIILGAIHFIVVMPILGVMGLGMASEMQNIQPGDEAQALSMLGPIMAMMGISQVFLFIIQILYYAFMESSKFQASIGKMVVGVKVTDLNGAKLDFTKALIRSASKLISSFILLIGYLMAAFTEKKQALHDMIAGTLVVKK